MLSYSEKNQCFMETTTLLNGFKETGTLAYETPQAQYQPFTCFVINTADHSIILD